MKLKADSFHAIVHFILSVHIIKIFIEKKQKSPKVKDSLGLK
jgi:hypothetical protein